MPTLPEAGSQIDVAPLNAHGFRNKFEYKNSKQLPYSKLKITKSNELLTYQDLKIVQKKKESMLIFAFDGVLMDSVREIAVTTYNMLNKSPWLCRYIWVFELKKYQAPDNK